MTGNELRHWEDRRDGNLGTDQTCRKTWKRLWVHQFFLFFINIILGVLSPSVAAVVRVCSFNATAFHLTLLRLFYLCFWRWIWLVLLRWAQPWAFDLFLRSVGMENGFRSCLFFFLVFVLFIMLIWIKNHYKNALVSLRWVLFFLNCPFYSKIQSDSVSLLLTDISRWFYCDNEHSLTAFIFGNVNIIVPCVHSKKWSKIKKKDGSALQ